MVECSRSYRTTDKHEKSMIKNIVFDLGNVLISFKPAEYFEKSGYPEKEKNVIINDIFSSREWKLIDNGDITTGEAIEKIVARSSLKQHEIASVFNLRREILYPVDKNIKLLPGLKKRGFKLYYLSNFPDDIFDAVYNEYPFFNFFDGGIISSRVNASKPDRKIFKILLDKYFLTANECLFIDDIELNVQSASSVGMTAICALESADLSELIEKELGSVFKI
jgi:HAD superfamily hydrolase (TIGR01509 family)